MQQDVTILDDEAHTNVVNFTPPALAEIMSFRGVHVLGDLRVTPEGRPQLIARFYCSCLIYGRSPVWAVYKASTGSFVRFYGYRSEIERAYPRLTWRRKMASWHLAAVDDLNPSRRRRFLAERYGKAPPEPADTPASVAKKAKAARKVVELWQVHEDDSK